jgi:hypothetical protein
VSIVEWDAQNGLIHRGGPEVVHPDGTQISTDLLKYLQAYKHEKTIFVLRDFHLHFDKVINIRMLRNAWNPLKSKGNMIVFVGHKYAVPGELQKEIQLMDYDLPDSKAIEERLLFIKNSANVSREKKGMPLVEIPEEIVDSAIEAAKGMTDAEVENAFSMAYISSGNFDNKFVETVFQEKIAQLKKNGLLTYMEPNIGFENVGGMQGLKNWLITRKKAYSKEAREYNLPLPKGMLLASVPGTGNFWL